MQSTPIPEYVLANRQACHRHMMVVRHKLAEQFPKCFKPFGKPKLPLMVGIDKAVWQAAPHIGYNWHDVLNAIADYTSVKSYLFAMIEGTPRIDLDGNAVRVVMLSHQQHARKQLRRILAKEQREKKEKQAAASAAKPVLSAKPIANKSVIPKTGAKKVVVEVKRRRVGA